MGIIFVALAIFGISSFEKGLTGNAVLDIGANYEEGKPLEGVLQFSFNDGELVPSNTKVVFENAGNVYEYSLADVASEKLTEGNFYVEGENLSGEGQGYGIPGENKIYPDVYFTLGIYSQEQTLSNSTTFTQSENNSITSSTQSENNSVNTSSEQSNEADNLTQTEEIVNETQITEENNTQGSLITGNSILRFITGAATGYSSEPVEKITGLVSHETPFTYEVGEGKSAEILSGSVKTSDNQLNDDDVNLEIKDNVVIVTTDYSESEKGFGQNYVGNSESLISVNLKDLNLIFEPGELNISLVYGEEIIDFMSTYLGEKQTTENTANISEPVKQISNPVVSENLALTDEEKTILLDKFKTLNVKTIRQEVVGNKLIVGSEYGNSKIEYVYAYPQDEKSLKVQIENDRTKWQKEIASSISKKYVEPQPVNII